MSSASVTCAARRKTRRRWRCGRVALRRREQQAWGRRRHARKPIEAGGALCWTGGVGLASAGSGTNGTPSTRSGGTELGCATAVVDGLTSFPSAMASVVPTFCLPGAEEKRSCALHHRQWCSPPGCHDSLPYLLGMWLCRPARVLQDAIIRNCA